MQVIEIHGKNYDAEALTQEAKGILGLMQMNQQNMGKLQADLGIAQAAAETLDGRLKLALKSVKPLPKTKVESPSAGAGGTNRKTRRATSSTRRKTPAKK